MAITKDMRELLQRRKGQEVERKQRSFETEKAKEKVEKKMSAR